MGVALAALVDVLGPALTALPVGALRLVVGGVLLVFGRQWLRTAILRGDGFKALHEKEAVFAQEVASPSGFRKHFQSCKRQISSWGPVLGSCWLSRHVQLPEDGKPGYLGLRSDALGVELAISDAERATGRYGLSMGDAPRFGISRYASGEARSDSLAGKRADRAHNHLRLLASAQPDIFILADTCVPPHAWEPVDPPPYPTKEV